MLGGAVAYTSNGLVEHLDCFAISTLPFTEVVSDLYTHSIDASTGTNCGVLEQPVTANARATSAILIR